MPDDGLKLESWKQIAAYLDRSERTGAFGDSH